MTSSDPGGRGCRGFRPNPRFLCILFFFALILSCVAQDSGAALLARIDLVHPVTELSLPVYSHLQDATGQNYVLVFATRSELEKAGWSYQVLDSGYEPSDYVFAAWRRRSSPRPDPGLPVIHDDGRSLLLRATEPEAETLAGLGYELRRFPRLPMLFAGSETKSLLKFKAFAYSELVADMIGEVKTTNLYTFVSRLSGVTRAVTGGEWYQILTRHTSKAIPTQRATEYAFQHLQALGLNVRYHSWSRGIYDNRNVVADLPGGSLASEIVLIVAHLDAISPDSTTTPGADDNASGSAGVLAVADILAKYRFDRTVRFVFFTGEEQGMYGSGEYAAAAYAVGDNITGVLNLDMISWDSDSSPTLRLHTRLTGDSGYAGDRAIAEVFTNVVANYGMAAHLTPIITADGNTYSDHSSFWNNGYPAILAIEDDDDFTPYYHQTSDTLSTLNLTYFSWFVKAAVGTIAHMAEPVRRVPFDVIQVDNGDWVAGSGIGVGTLYAKHQEGATETGTDSYDVAWSNAAVVSTNAQWLKIQTQPYASLLQTDARPTNSGTIFHGTLSAVKTGSGSFTCTNRLCFTYLASAESNRLYTVRIHVDGTYAHDSSEFDCVTNLRELVAGGGCVNLPGLVGLTNGAVYGTCDIASCPIATEPTNFPMGIVAVTGGTVTLSMPAQVGSRIVDVVEGSTNLLATSNLWTVITAFTNYVPPDAANFESGWQTLGSQVDLPFTNSDAVYFRFLRQWQSP